MLERAVRRIEKHLDRCGLLGTKEDDLDLSSEGDPESNLASSAVSGQSPPAGPQWSSGLRPLKLHALAYDKPLCASLDGFTLHAASAKPPLGGPARAGLTPRVARRCCDTSCVARGQAARSADCAGASGAATRWPCPHHPEEGLRRWDGRS